MGAPKSTSLGNFAFHAHLLLQECLAVPCGGETMHIECLRSKATWRFAGFEKNWPKRSLQWTHVGESKLTHGGFYTFNELLMCQNNRAVHVGGGKSVFWVFQVRSKAKFRFLWPKNWPKRAFCRPTWGIPNTLLVGVHLQWASHVSELSCCTLWVLAECVFGVWEAKPSKIWLFRAILEGKNWTKWSPADPYGGSHTYP